MDEYVVVSRLGNGETKVAGPYSERQAREVEGKTLGIALVVRLVRPTWWLSEDDDLARYQPERAER